VQDQRRIAGTESVRNRQVGAHRVGIAQVMNGKRRLVGQDGTAAAPQVPQDIGVVLASGPVWDPEDTPPDPFPVSPVRVILLRRVGVPDLTRLSGREVTGLARFRRSARGT
jgi:hypothetical protein